MYKHIVALMLAATLNIHLIADEKISRFDGAITYLKSIPVKEFIKEHKVAFAVTAVVSAYALASCHSKSLCTKKK